LSEVGRRDIQLTVVRLIESIVTLSRRRDSRNEGDVKEVKRRTPVSSQTFERDYRVLYRSLCSRHTAMLESSSGCGAAEEPTAKG